MRKHECAYDGCKNMILGDFCSRECYEKFLEKIDMERFDD